MSAQSSFDYAVIRVVPRVEREEFVNAGVILYSAELRFLGARVQCDEARWAALWPGFETEEIRRRLVAFERVAAGDAAAGPIARMSQRERFHWMVSPRSTVVQVSAVHTGISGVPERALAELMERMV